MIQLALPFNKMFPITQRFGEKITDPKGHSGVDFALPKGTPVLAAADGVVKAVHWSQTGYGIHLILDHGGGVETIYAHLLTTSFPAGTAIQRGKPIALSGSSGNSTGPHLHFEVRIPLFEGAANDETDGAGRKWVVSVDRLNVRSGPSLAYAVVGGLDRGEVVGELARRESTWIRIGVNEWVAATYMNETNAKILPDGAPAPIRKGSFKRIRS